MLVQGGVGTGVWYMSQLWDTYQTPVPTDPLSKPSRKFDKVLGVNRVIK